MHAYVDEQTSDRQEVDRPDRLTMALLFLFPPLNRSRVRFARCSTGTGDPKPGFFLPSNSSLPS